jgi:hypothetical protein
MPNPSHDHNFKNLFLDFPRESLSWLFPQALETWGEVRHIEFVRQESKKRKLSDAVLILDLPILFTFDDHQLLRQSRGEDSAAEKENRGQTTFFCIREEAYAKTLGDLLNAGRDA